MSGPKAGPRPPRPTQKAASGGFFGDGPGPAGSLLAFDRSFGLRPLCGLDEAGRGPLAGPLVAAAVVLRPDWDNPAVDDSKRLSPGERDRLYGLIAREAAAFSVAVLENSEVDCLNPLGASMKAMREALLGLPEAPALALVDGDRLPDLPCRARAVVKGDSLSLSIAAASIVAKVTRDRLMLELHAKFPGYGFDRHKGYGTAAHLAALRELGPSPVHRLSFRGVLQGPGAPSPKGGGHGGPGGPGPGPGGPPGGLGLGG